MDTRMAQLWFPTLIVGLGGTGIRAVRFLHLLIANDTTGVLRGMVEAGALSFVGIDTDTKANQPERVDERLTPAHAGRLIHGSQELPVFEGLVTVDTEAIVNALGRLRLKEEPKGPDRAAHVAIRAWFPEMDARNDISVGQAFTGAAQWRLLGRVGFFLQYPNIHARLLDAFTRVKSASTDRPRVLIISSLSGGTGSGMFWDTAFLLRHFDQRCLISGMFLLPSAFDGLNGQKRVKPNAYAALKEIATYKNWQQSHTFTVRYPSQGATYVARPGDRPAFNAVYLYHAFKTDGMAKNLPKQRVLSSCLGLAQNALALMRVDMHLATGEGKDNDPGDVGADRGSDEASFAFSTTACTPIPILDTATVARRFHACLLDHMRTTTLASEHWPTVANGDLRQALLVRHDATRSADGWIASMVASMADQLPERPPRLAAMLGALDRGRAEADTLIDRFTVEQPFPATELAKEVKRIYESFTDQTLRDGWANDLNRQIDHDPRPPNCVLGDARARFLNELDDMSKRIAKALAAREQDMDRAHSPLTTDDTALLKMVAQRLRALQANPVAGRSAIDAQLPQRARLLGMEPGGPAWANQSTTGGPTPPDERPQHPEQEWLVTAPATLLLIRVTIGLVRQRQPADQALQRAHDELGAIGPAHLALRKFFVDLSSDLTALGRHAPVIADAERYFAAREHALAMADGLAERLEALIAHSDRLRADLDRSVVDIAAAIGRAAPEGIGPDWPQQLRNLLAPLPRLLNALPAPDTDQRPYLEHARGITGIIEETGKTTKRWGPKTIDLPSGARETMIDAWVRVIADLRVTLSQAVPASILVALFDPLSKKIAGFRPPLLADAAALHDFLHDLEAISSGFVAHWCGQDDITLERLGSTDGIARLIGDHMPDVFNDGVRQNDLRRSHFLVAPPLFDGLAGASPRIAHDLEAGFRTAASTAKTELPRVIGASPHPVIYYEDICRAGDEIEGIHDYFVEYQRIPKEKRRNYHLFPDAEDVGELVSPFDERRRIPCGNPGCVTHDIRTQSPTDIFCAGCSNPIRNRCGNLLCSETDLATRIREKRIGNLAVSRTGIPYKCPECLGDLRTYWWYCGSHKGQPITTTIAQCSQCEVEHLDNRRQHASISRLEGGVGIECPGCLTTGAKASELRRVPWALKTYFEDGIARFNAEEFERIAMQPVGHLLECDNQRVKRHFRYPAYRSHDNQVVSVFRVSAGQGKPEAWRADSLHPGIHFDTCFHCGHPVVTAPDTLLVGSGVPAVECPRCLRALRHCAWCSPTDRTLLKGEAVGSGGPLRCPRCTNDMELIASDAIARPGNSEKAGFCRNLFGCNAGSQPWNAVSDLERIDGCVVCDGQFTDRVKLLHRHRLSSYVEDCPLCLLIVGLPKDGKVHRFLAIEVMYRFMRHASVKNDGAKAVDLLPQDKHCSICSSHRGRVLRWLSQDDRLADGVPVALPYYGVAYPPAEAASDLVEMRQKLDKIAPALTVGPATGIEILEVLSQNMDDTRVYQRLNDQKLLIPEGGNVLAIRQSLLTLFTDQSVSSGTLNRRLQAVNDQHVRNRQLEDGLYTPVEGELAF